MRVFVVGAGSVAQSFAAAILGADGVTLAGVWSRSESSAWANLECPVYCSNLPPQKIATDVILFAVADSAISDVAGAFSAAGCLGESQVLLHCSGALDYRAVFSHCLQIVGGVGVLHPLRSFARPESSLADTVFGVAGDLRGATMGERLCEELGGKPLLLRGEQMPGYHAAAVMASNYVVAVVDAAHQLMIRSGVDGQTAETGLIDLAAGALENIRRVGLPSALTGPIRRGDVATIEQNIRGVDRTLPAASALYREIGLWCIGMSERIGEADSAALAGIHALLDGAETEKSQ